MRTRYVLLILGLLVVAIAALVIITTAPKTGSTATDGTPTPAINAGTTLHGDSVTGRLYFELGGGIWRWAGSDGTQIGVLTAGTSPIIGFTPVLTQPAISPDGKRLAYIRRDESYSDLFVANADGSGAKALTTNKGQGVVRSPDYANSSVWAYAPAWSPDGTQIAYLSDNGTNDPALWIIAASGGQPRRVSSFGQGSGGIQRPTWSSTGGVAAGVFQNTTDAIFSFNTRTGAAAQLVGNGYDAAWSPDGTHIAFVQRRAGSSATDLVVAAADGSGGVVVSQNLSARSPAWSPDGTQIAFLGLKDKAAFFDIYVTDAAKPNQRQISHDAPLTGAGGVSWGS